MYKVKKKHRSLFGLCKLEKLFVFRITKAVELSVVVNIVKFIRELKALIRIMLNQHQRQILEFERECNPKQHDT